MRPGAGIVRGLAVCMVCLAWFAPAFALELGPIEARSMLHEPLDARIPVRDAHSGDLEGLNAELGSPAQFELAGVARLQHLDLLEFVVVAESESGGYIHVRTDEPITEPSLTFLVDVDWPRGRTVRGYKLNLASAAGSVAVNATIRRVEPAVVTESEAESEAEAETAPPPTTAASTPTSSEAGYGPVRRSETLWSIASRVRPDTSVSTQRMMLAILEANPEAFIIRNVNALREGVTLRIPTRDEIGPDDPGATAAEMQRQQAAWLEYRKSASTRTTPAAMDSDSEAQPGGRIEVVSPEAASEAGAQEGGGEISSLRRELALAVEETDAVRRENEELTLRLAGVEDRISDLNRLVALKDEEIAALRSELSARPESMPAQEAQPVAAAADRIGELSRLVELKDEEIAMLRSELSARPESMPAQEAESMAGASDRISDLNRLVELKDEEIAALRAELSASSATTPAAMPETEAKPLPFGLGNLPVNPVFLVGGAGLLLLLLGVLALLRRRRASTDVKEDALEAADASSSDEDELLGELEAVAAELSGERHDPPARQSRAGPTVVADEGTSLGPGELAEQRIAELWRDEDDRVPDRGRSAGSDADELALDIRGLTTDDTGPGASEDALRDELTRAEGAVEKDSEPAEASSSRTADSGASGLALPATAEDAPERDSDAPKGRRPDARPAAFGALESEGANPDAPAPAAGAGDATVRDLGLSDDEQDGELLALLDDDDSVIAQSVESETTGEAGAGSAGVTAERSADRAPEPDDSDGPSPAEKKALPDEPADGVGDDALPLEDVGEDEVQTKIDLAQVYMEMGDTESARGFLEAVLAEGDAEQRDTARDMLSRLS